MAKSVWRRNDLIYYNRKINNNDNGSSPAPSIPEFYMVQGEPHKIQTSLDENDRFMQGSKLHFFYRYYPGEAVTIDNQPTIPFSKRYIPIVRDDRMLFYCSRMRIREYDQSGTEMYNYDYGKALLNYFISFSNLRWGNVDNSSWAYLVVGTGTDLYWLRVHHQSTDRTNDTYWIYTYNSDYRGTDHWIPLENTRNNRFIMDYTALQSDCVTNIVTDLDSLSEFSGHPEADVFIIGIPKYVSVQDPTFSQDDLFKIITMVCGGSSSPYTNLTAKVVEHSV